MASKEYLYRVKNRTPGAPDRYVKGRLPSQALAFVAADVLSAELCDGIAGAEAVLAGFKIESALTPASSPEPEPQPELIAQAFDHDNPPTNAYTHGILGNDAPLSPAAEEMPAPGPTPGDPS